MSEHADGGLWDRAWQKALNAIPVNLDTPGFENEIDRRKTAFVGADLPQQGRAMELGCGSARLLARFGRQAPLILYGVDLSAPSLQLAWQTAIISGTVIRPVQADVHFLPYAGGTFDIV